MRLRAGGLRTLFGLTVGWLAAAGACIPPGAFVCSDDAECGPSGACEAIGYCSVPADDCASGRRYSPYAPDEHARKCVQPDPGTSSTGALASTGAGSTTTTTAATTGSIGTSTGAPAESSSTTGPTISACLPEGRTDTVPVLLYDFCEDVGSTATSVDSVLEVSLELRFENGAIGRGFQWVEDGLLLDGDSDATTALRSVEPVFERLEACQAAGEVTLEVWATPLHESQGGPTRLVELGTNQPNTAGTDLALMMNPEWAQPGYVGVVRTSEDGSAGGLRTEWAGIPLLRATHFAVVHGQGTDTLYIDAEVAATQPHPGDLSVWNPNYELVLGNAVNYEVRNWAGTFHMVAIYCQALTPAEILQNYEAGPRPDADSQD